MNTHVLTFGVLATAAIMIATGYLWRRRELKGWRRAVGHIDAVKISSSAEGPDSTTVVVRYQPQESRTEITADQTFCGERLGYRLGGSVEILYNPKDWWDIEIHAHIG